MCSLDRIFQIVKRQMQQCAYTLPKPVIANSAAESTSRENNINIQFDRSQGFRHESEMKSGRKVFEIHSHSCAEI